MVIVEGLSTSLIFDVNVHFASMNISWLSIKESRRREVCPLRTFFGMRASELFDAKNLK